MKIIYTTDLHGDQRKYLLLFEAAKAYGADAVINGGDMLPKDKDTFNEQRDFIENFLNEYFDRYTSAGIHYLCCLGNDDYAAFDKLFDEVCSRPFIANIAQRKVALNGYEFIGMNYVVDYPFRLKDRCREDTADYVFGEQLGTGLLSGLGDELEEIADWPAYADTLPTIEDELRRLPCPENMAGAVYVIHMPPYRLGLDKCGNGAEVGSKAVYDFLQKEHPMLSLHGHIHESPHVTGIWQTKLGNTVCIQPGQNPHKLTYVTIELPGMEFDRKNVDVPSRMVW